MHFYCGFIQHFSLSKLLHTDSRLGIQCLARCSKQVRPRERERERGRRAIWIGVWSVFKRFSRVLTWSDQKHPAGTCPCSHKGRPLMPLPWLPCWPNPPHIPPAYSWLGAAMLSLYIETKVLFFCRMWQLGNFAPSYNRLLQGGSCFHKYNRKVS